MEIVSPKLYNWASILDEQTKQQALKTSRLGIVQPHLALMPDAHLGIGATVGSVIPTVGALIPAAVGVDIGCGMIAVRTQLTKDDFKEGLPALRKSIERAIPSSAGRYNQELSDSSARRVESLLTLAGTTDYSTYSDNWELQLGTLGSGNHFIEITYDESDAIWLFLHSGSRGIGNKIAGYHIKVAQKVCKEKLEDRDLAYLEQGTDEFNEYVEELKWAQHFALLNREEMMDRLIHQVERYIVDDVKQLERINCHHNFTQLEQHFDTDLWISRKGAISAHDGEYGLIPGSMGTASYVVVGKGNYPSFMSSPHGAGRVYSRGEAKRTFTLDDLKAAMGDIEYNVSEAFLDEIPAAYKDIDQVMEDSKDLVAIEHTLHQLVNVKGQ